FYLVGHLRGALRLRGLSGRQRLQVLDGEQRVLVGGELVIDVVLDQARQGAELRQVPSQQPDLVHLRECLRRPSPPPADVEKQVAYDRRALKRAVGEVERILDGALEIERQLA